ncbi:MAG: SBBP repeat-containing protein [Promethearchaeota archaeon]
MINLYITTLNINTPNEDNYTNVDDLKTSSIANNWYRLWGGLDYERANDITIDKFGNLYITGYTYSFGISPYSMFIIKYNAKGMKLWNYTWGTPYKTRGNAIIADNESHFYVTGVINNTITGSDNMFLVKFDSNGNELWNFTWGGSNDDEGNDIVIDGDGYIYVCGITDTFGGNFIAKFDKDKTSIWNATWNFPDQEYAECIAIDKDNNIYVAGVLENSTTSYQDLMLVKYSSSNKQLWNFTRWRSNADEWIDGIAVDQDSNVYITGFIEGPSDDDLALYKYNHTGKELWQYSWDGGDWDDVGRDITLDKKGNLYIAGTSYSYAKEDEVLLLKYDCNGRIKDQLIWGGSDDDRAEGIVINNVSDIFIAGYTRNFGSGFYGQTLFAKFSGVLGSSKSDNNESGNDEGNIIYGYDVFLILGSILGLAIVLIKYRSKNKI